MYMYHYFPVLPFMMLAITGLFKHIDEKYKLTYLIPIYLIFVIAFFIIYYPVITGNVVSIDYLKKIELFKSWYF